eukprot:5839011-Pleurochrysis_carterae.AAC.1
MAFGNPDCILHSKHAVVTFVYTAARISMQAVGVPGLLLRSTLPEDSSRFRLLEQLEYAKCATAAA